ncbi:MAG: metal ABC transporter substrate-binding protein [Ignavibacteria bacterium]|nr:metal ABC transporter substrate-binding protein [Ignavibacteria bacterium]
MKHLLIIFLITLISCSKKVEESNKYIFTSNHPLKLIVQELVSEKSLVQSLIPPNVSEHTFEPKVSDVNKLENASVFIYVSKEIDGWVTKDLQNCVEALYLLPKEQVLLFSNGSVDPHFWTSPRTVVKIIDTLAKLLSLKFPLQKETILKNAEIFKAKLEKLDKKLDSSLSIIKEKPIFLFHPSFLYLIRDYGLKYGGSIEEIPGGEPTPSHISAIINKIKDAKIRSIFSEPQLNPHSAEIIAKETNTKLYQIDPLGVNAKTYEEFVLLNVQQIIEALK